LNCTKIVSIAVMYVTAHPAVDVSREMKEA